MVAGCNKPAKLRAEQDVEVVKNGEDGTYRLDGIDRSKGWKWCKPDLPWEWTHVGDIDGGEVLWKAQERSSMENVYVPKGTYMIEIGPHSLRSVSVGDAKVSVVPSGTAPWRGVWCRTNTACSVWETRRENLGSSLRNMSTTR